MSIVDLLVATSTPEQLTNQRGSVRVFGEEFLRAHAKSVYRLGSLSRHSEPGFEANSVTDAKCYYVYLNLPEL